MSDVSSIDILLSEISLLKGKLDSIALEIKAVTVQGEKLQYLQKDLDCAWVRLEDLNREVRAIKEKQDTCPAIVDIGWVKTIMIGNTLAVTAAIVAAIIRWFVQAHNRIGG